MLQHWSHACDDGFAPGVSLPSPPLRYLSPKKHRTKCCALDQEFLVFLFHGLLWEPNEYYLPLFRTKFSIFCAILLYSAWPAFSLQFLYNVVSQLSCDSVLSTPFPLNNLVMCHHIGDAIINNTFQCLHQYLIYFSWKTFHSLMFLLELIKRSHHTESPFKWNLWNFNCFRKCKRELSS